MIRDTGGVSMLHRGRAPQYPEFRGLYMRRWTEPVHPHFLDVDSMETRERAASACDWVWSQAEASGIAADELARAIAAVDGGRPTSGIAEQAVEIAREGCRRGGRMVPKTFLESVDGSGYARYSLFIMEDAGRLEGYRYVSAHDAVEALALVISVADRGLSRGGPFDVGIYEVTPAGRKVRYTPMVWPGGPHRSGLRLPEAMRRDLAASGIELSELCSVAAARAGLARATGNPERGLA